MRKILKTKSNIDAGRTDVFIASKDLSWDGVPILKDSLVVVDKSKIYINGTPLNFYSLLDNLYGEILKDFKDGNSFVIRNDYEREDAEEINIHNGEVMRWNDRSFSHRCVPYKKELEERPTFKYKDVEYSSWSYEINLETKEIEGGFYKQDGKFFEMTSISLKDIEVKS